MGKSTKMGHNFQVADYVERNVDQFFDITPSESFCSDELEKRIHAEVIDANVQPGDSVTLIVKSNEGVIRHQTQWLRDVEQDNTHIQNRIELSRNNYAGLFNKIKDSFGVEESTISTLNSSIDHEFDRLRDQ